MNMRIVVVDGRHFLIEDRGQVFDVALKLLNEWRAMGSLEGKILEFAESACDAVDGELAWELLRRIQEVEVIVPEYVR